MKKGRANKKGNSRLHFNHNKQLLKCKRSQIAIFVIIAIVLVAGIAGYFLLKDRLFGLNLPADIKPAYDYYIECVEANIRDGASILGSQGGYIELPNFEPGSEYAPFSSQLDFFGIGVPYWYYVSGNGIIKEQVPLKKEMQNSLNDYLEERLSQCVFDDFIRQGYEIELGEAVVKTEIKNNEIAVNVKQSISLSKGERSAIITNHNINLDSKLGAYYDLARGIYEYEAEEAFLENYALDVLYNYAPVSGSELTCKPLIWNPYEVFEDLQEGLSANIHSIKLKGDYYDLDESSTRKYFVVDPGFDVGNNQVNFLYDSDWPSRFEVWPTKSNIMKSEPVGTQEGLSAMGFCYNAYKFVYDVSFPVLIQLQDSSGTEIFQFPVSIVIAKNQIREAIQVTGYEEFQESICDNANTEIEVYTYNNYLEPIEADLEFKCFTDICDLGSTDLSESDVAKLTVMVPQCANGIIIANSEGYKEKRYIISTNQETIADIILDRKYELDVELFVDGRLSKDFAVITATRNFNGTEDVTSSVSYPYNPLIELSDGDYIFDVKVYKSGSITIPSTTSRQCVDVPRSGIAGFFGAEEEECFDYATPEQTLTNVFYAGGYQKHYITESELENSEKIRIYTTSIETPKTMEELIEGYNIIESKDLTIELL